MKTKIFLIFVIGMCLIGIGMLISYVWLSCTEHISTLNQVKVFLLTDKTDRNDYTASYQCADFCADVINNANDAGLKCGLVLLFYDEGQHSIVVFQIDKGLVYVEPQTDEVIEIKVGDIYPDKLVTKILVIW